MTTIQHGIPADLHRPLFEKGKYFAFLGRSFSRIKDKTELS